MPCDYKKYPQNWFTEIRPAILRRAANRCEVCGVENGKKILRGVWCGREVYQDVDGWVYDAATSDRIGGDYLGEVCEGEGKVVKVVLTIAHLDHDTKNNNPENLKAMCQLHHLRHDRLLHMKNAQKTRVEKSGAILMFE